MTLVRTTAPSTLSPSGDSSELLIALGDDLGSGAVVINLWRDSSDEPVFASTIASAGEVALVDIQGDISLQ